MAPTGTAFCADTHHLIAYPGLVAATAMTPRPTVWIRTCLAAGTVHVPHGVTMTPLVNVRQESRFGLEDRLV